MFSALGYRNYRFLVSGNLATQIGYWTQQIGIQWLVWELTGSALQLGLAVFFHGAALTLFAFVGGALADRLDRKRMLIASQLAMVVVGLALAFLVISDVIAVWHVYVMVFLGGTINTVNNPARQTMVYDVVPREYLPNAIAVNSVAFSVTRVVGPGVAGTMLAFIGVEGTFFAQAVWLGLAAALSVKIKGQFRPVTKQSAKIRQSIFTGLAYAKRDRTIALLLYLSLASAIFAWPYVQLMSAYASEVFDLGGKGFGFMMAAMGAGAMVGSLVLAAANVKRKGRGMLILQLATGGMLILLGVSSILPVSVIFLALVGSFNGTQTALTQTLLQLNVRDEYRGRVMSVFLLGFGLQPFGALPAGGLADAFGIQWALVSLGGLFLLAVVPVVIFSGRVRRL